MKKQQRFYLCTILIAIILGLASNAYAECIHDSYYWDKSEVESYTYYGPEACFRTTYWDIECRICGERWIIVLGTSIVNHNWYCIDLGHIAGEALHKFETGCSQCGYSVITEEFCPLIH
ncbi:MAG: hypothetical protein WC332_06590 [Clostridia bacterium]|jgi:hypothetical protein